MRTLSPSIQTQGSTASASTLVVQFSDAAGLAAAFLRVRVCDAAGYANATNATIAPANGCTTIETHTSGKDLTLKSSTLASAVGTLTIADVVIDGETVTVGGNVYEFDTSATANVTAGHVRVAIDHANAASTINAQGTLSLGAEPTAGDSMVVGTRSYSFVANGTAADPGEISIGTTCALATTNIIAALNGSDGVNTANSKASAAAGTNVAATQTLTSDNTAPSDGDTVTIGTKVYTFKTALTPTEGQVLINSTADAALLNLIRAINHTGTPNTDYKCAAANASASAAASVTAHAFVITALTAGGDGNGIASTETSAHLSFGAATLTGGLSKITLTALNGGVSGNSLVTTKVFTSGTNVFDAATLGTTTAGVDCSATHAATALRTAINGNANRVTNATGSSGTVTLTALTSGVGGNTIATTETMANGSFGGSTLSGGVNGISNFISFTVTDASAETVTLRFGPALLSPIHADHTPTKNVTHA